MCGENLSWGLDGRRILSEVDGEGQRLARWVEDGVAGAEMLSCNENTMTRGRYMERTEEIAIYSVLYMKHSARERFTTSIDSP